MIWRRQSSSAHLVDGGGRLAGMKNKSVRNVPGREVAMRIASLVMMAAAKRLWRAAGVQKAKAIKAPVTSKTPKKSKNEVTTKDLAAASSTSTAGIVIAVAVVAAIVASLVAFTVRARRQGYSGMGGDTIVRCREGHLFTTLWVPGASFKAVRLGMKRYQHCPVGDHWTLVEPVNDADLTDADRQEAAEHHDVRVI